MNQYMVEIILPEHLSQDFMDLIPAQRELVNEMFERGVITSYTLAMDRSKVWATFAAKTSKEVQQVVKSFPIAKYIEFTIHELAFHEASNTVMPSISLN